MITKIIDNSWDWGEPGVKNIIRTDPGLTKEAQWYATYQPEDGKTYAHALFLGASESYGPNNNGDAFFEDELIKKHGTFVTHAKHYKHHENKDPEKSYGDVKEAYYNPEMKRVEGIIAIDNEKSPAMVEKIAKGEPVPLSMAAKVAYDICSICGHKSRKIEEYCGHLKHAMTQILDDGRQVFAINPDPTFFDISEVIRGADPTAFTFKKVASHNRFVKTSADRCLYTIDILKKNLANKRFGHYNLIEKYAYNLEKTPYMDKLSILRRLAAIEKKIVGMIPSQDSNIKHLSKGISFTPAKIENTSDLPYLVGSMSKTGIALKISDLYDGKLNKSAMFRTLLNSSKRDQILESLPDEREYPQYSGLDHLAEQRSLLSKYANRRIEDNYFTKLAAPYVIDEEHPLLLKLAAINLSAVTNNPQLLEDSTFPELLILQNLYSV